MIPFLTWIVKVIYSAVVVGLYMIERNLERRVSKSVWHPWIEVCIGRRHIACKLIAVVGQKAEGFSELIREPLPWHSSRVFQVEAVEIAYEVERTCVARPVSTKLR